MRRVSGDLAAPALACMAAGILVVVASRSGVSWSWDSADYVAASKSLAEGRGVLDVTGRPMTIRPPGYPAILAGFRRLGAPTNWSLLLANLASAVATVACTALVVRRAASRTATAVAAFAVAASPALLWQWSMAWSEPAFIALVMGAMAVGLGIRNAAKYPVLTALFAAMFLVRYVGPVFAAPIAAGSLLADRTARGWVRSTALNGAALAASLPVAWWWLARNERIDGTLTGARQAGGGTLFDAALNGAATLGGFASAQPFDAMQWQQWSDYPFPARGAAVATLLLVAAGATGWLLARRRSDGHGVALATVAAAGGTVAIYLAFSAWRFVNVELGLLDTRMMSPVLAPLVVVLVVVVDRALAGLRRPAIAATGAAALLLAVHATVSVRDALDFGRDGRHMSTAGFRDLELHRAARALPDLDGLFSNAPQQLAAAVDAWPIFDPWQPDEPRTCVHRYAVWYKGFQVQDNIPDMTPVVFDDPTGTIYDLGPCSVPTKTFWD